MSFADQVLDWVLRHGKAAGAAEEHELVLVYDHDALEDPSPSAELGGHTWRIKRVTGELTLRDALLDAGRLVAIVPNSFVVPMDLAGRAWLGRPVRVRPRDFVAALTLRPCEPIIDEQIAKAVEASLPQLRKMGSGWSVGGTVSVREIRNVLLGLQVGTEHRFDRESPDALLARWILEGPPEVTSAELLTQALRQEHSKLGAWLAWAVTDGTVEDVVAAGALAGSPEGVARSPEIPTVSGSSDRQRLKSVVEQAVRAAWGKNPTRTRRVLEAAERRSGDLSVGTAPRHPLLAGPLERFLVDAAKRAAAGEPVDDAVLEALSTNLHLAAHRSAWELTRGLSRLARFGVAVEPISEDGLREWAEKARTDIAWGDLAFRRVRRGLGDADPRLTSAAKLVLQQYMARRDELNAAFGSWLASNWNAVAGQVDRRQTFGLHHVSRLVLRPLLDDGQKVLLVVLDGCDLASMVDLVEMAADQHQVALGLPKFGDVDLRESFKGSGAWRVAVAPIPTVTSHARRALFAGDIPKNSALDDTEEAAANASNDKKAFKDNPALGKVSRTLLLKGDVGDLGEAVKAALDSTDQLVAVVLNDVDDALSSKETTPMRPWTLEALGAGAATWLKHALDTGWSVVVTADHGHTPYVSSSRKVRVSGAGGRIASEPGNGVVVVDAGPIPTQPLHLLSGFGTWRGAQRRGWHGGVGLEEVFVPLAFLRRGSVHDEQFRRPSWWSRLPEPDEEPRKATPAPAPKRGPFPEKAPPAPQIEVPEDVASALKFFPRGLELVRHVIVAGPVEVSAVAIAMELPDSEVRGLVGHVLDFLGKHGAEHTVVVSGSQLSWSEGASEDDWLQRITDESDRSVLGYLSRHGAIIESDLVELIGHPRRARRFAGRVEELSAVAPFRIQVDALPDGSKRYSTVKD